MRQILSFFLILSIPLVSFGATQPKTFQEFVEVLLNLIQLLVTGIFAITLIVFIWGVAQAWIIHGGDPKKVDEGKQIVTVGIIVLAIMSALWGIVALLRSGFFSF